MFWADIPSPVSHLEGDREFADSPLEGGVYRELVSEVGFPGLVEKAGFQGVMDDNGSVETLFWARIRWNFVERNGYAVGGRGIA